ncbi:replication protein A, subunit RPA32 [Aspergillus sclerotiicarbonarius CBS 121057]|uniref:Replication protein A, subunit RPA32 n=1 Tax=Aspergillus sclerotiicarbonarius (strain CBS 121057 / IBT 28362) TaxID=1448318 RepID=A0A319ENF9_ASPSB|nr:replication protein A, subunit RPA32 [Aspergillus sclerotiicarbonarius CBS 121057]
MPGEMNSPSGGKTDYTNATLRPITIKQALDAMQPYPEAPYQIDSAEVASVTFIGQVRNISSQSTNVTYKLDDGTGEIEAKQWIDSMTADSMDTDDPNNSTSNNKNQVELNGYARVFGKLKSFGNKRFVGAHCVRPVKDINELHCHLLEASAVHLFFTRGPSNAQSGAGAEGGGMKGGDSTMGGVGAAGDDYGAGKGLPAMSPVAKRVYHLLKTEPQSNEGLHAQLIAAKLSLPMPDVARAGDELLTAGVIFSTVDEHTWAILEF